MNRRRVLAALASTMPLAGCTGGSGDPITMLAVNLDDSARSVTVWVARRETLVVANAVDVASGDAKRLGRIQWKSGHYRVTVQVDGEPRLAEEFRSDDWFNQLDVFVASDGAVELNRGRAA